MYKGSTTRVSRGAVSSSDVNPRTVACRLKMQADRILSRDPICPQESVWEDGDENAWRVKGPCLSVILRRKRAPKCEATGRASS